MNRHRLWAANGWKMASQKENGDAGAGNASEGPSASGRMDVAAGASVPGGTAMAEPGTLQQALESAVD